MSTVTTTVQSLQDAREGKPAIAGLKPDDFTRLELRTFAILEGGMQSGKTSTMLQLKDEKGRDYIAEVSAAMFDALWHALQGAEQRFVDEKTT